MEFPQETVRNLRMQSLKGSKDALEIIGAGESALEVGSGLEAAMGVRRAIERLKSSALMLDKTGDEFLRTQV